MYVEGISKSRALVSLIAFALLVAVAIWLSTWSPVIDGQQTSAKKAVHEATAGQPQDPNSQKVCGEYDTQPKKCKDSDDDGTPDNKDKDDDNDGVPDKCEKKKKKGKRKKCIENNT